jgi:hypothetical protein
VDPTISGLIGAAAEGDVAAADFLFSALYAELHRLAKLVSCRNPAIEQITRNVLNKFTGKL